MTSLKTYPATLPINVKAFAQTPRLQSSDFLRMKPFFTRSALSRMLLPADCVGRGGKQSFHLAGIRRECSRILPQSAETQFNSGGLTLFSMSSAQAFAELGRSLASTKTTDDLRWFTATNLNVKGRGWANTTRC